MSTQLSDSIDFTYESIDAPQYYNLGQLGGDASFSTDAWFDTRRSSIMPGSALPPFAPPKSKEPTRTHTAQDDKPQKTKPKREPKVLQVPEGDTASGFPVRSVKALTEPKEFTFSTSMRARASRYPFSGYPSPCLKFLSFQE